MEDYQALLIATEIGRIQWEGGDISNRVGEFVDRIAAVDPSDEKLPTVIRLLARALPQDEHFPTRLTTLFTKAVSVPPSRLSALSGDKLVQNLFYANPDVLAKPFVDFVRGDPMGERQTKLLTDIFNPTILLRDAVECYPPESYDQKVWGLKRAAAGIDNLRTERGLGHIVRLVLDSVAFKKDADKQYKTLFPA